jgi:hypothetical protein
VTLDGAAEEGYADDDFDTLCGQVEKREGSHEADQEAAGPTGTGETDDASRAKRPRTLPTPAAPLEASGLLESMVKREPEEGQKLLAVGGEVGEKHGPDLLILTRGASPR